MSTLFTSSHGHVTLRMPGWYGALSHGPTITCKSLTPVESTSSLRVKGCDELLIKCCDKLWWQVAMKLPTHEQKQQLFSNVHQCSMWGILFTCECRCQTLSWLPPLPLPHFWAAWCRYGSRCCRSQQATQENNEANDFIFLASNDFKNTIDVNIDLLPLFFLNLTWMVKSRINWACFDDLCGCDCACWASVTFKSRIATLADPEDKHDNIHTEAFNWHHKMSQKCEKLEDIPWHSWHLWCWPIYQHQRVIAWVCLHLNKKLSMCFRTHI